VVNNRNIKCEL